MRLRKPRNAKQGMGSDEIVHMDKDNGILCWARHADESL